MNILVLNGSPKGKYSITLQTTNYLMQKYPDHNFEILDVGQKTRSLERDFSPAAEMIDRADLLIFSYPVYTFIAPYQLHRFIELLKASGMNLSGKFATQISTSKHFYDVTAHRYIQDNCCDMGMKYIKGLSADMDDLLTEKGQKEARDFLEYVCFCINNDIYEKSSVTVSEPKHRPVSVPENKGDKQGDIVVLTNCESNDEQLKNMIARFQAVMPRKTRIVNIGEYPFKGGCLGC